MKENKTKTEKTAKNVATVSKMKKKKSDTKKSDTAQTWRKKTAGAASALARKTAELSPVVGKKRMNRRN